jgi:RNA polymerase-binding transcription factor DksA
MAEMTEEQKRTSELNARKAEETYAQCNRIDDPVRRGLCKVCGTPVAGVMPFCQQHEPPVP